MLDKAITLIEEQQAKQNEYSPVFCVGEQLKDILNTYPDAAEAVAQKLQQPGITLVACEKRIAEFAMKHRNGSFGFCPPKEAERIICEFFSINKDAGNDDFKMVNLTDFM